MYERWRETIDLKSREAETAHGARWAAVERDAELARTADAEPRARTGRLAPAVRRIAQVAQLAAGWFF